MIRKKGKENVPRIVSDTVNEGIGITESFGEEVVSINDKGFSSRSLSAAFSLFSLFPFAPLPTSPSKTPVFFFPLFRVFPLLAFRLPGVVAATAPFSTSASASLSSLSSAAGRGI